MGLGKRKVSEIQFVDETRYNKRRRKSISPRSPISKKNLSGSGDSCFKLSENDKGYCRLSHPVAWSSGKHDNECCCHRHSDSGFDTKSVRSPKRKQKSHCRRRVKEDEEGHLVYKEGDHLLDRYQLGRTIGQGTFGKVVVAFDTKKDNKKVAIKIVKKDQADYEDAVLEAKIIQQLQDIDDGPSNLCIRVLDWFDYYGHLCIVFDMLGHSVYEFMRRNNFQPFSIDDVQKIAYRLCKAVQFCHDKGLAHTDLKPENILFVDSKFDFTTTETCHKRGAFRQIRDCDIRLIDFGSAVFKEDHNKGLVSTRHYRAPEVILELGWSFPCDVWSVGCILFEIYYGRTLFQTHDTMEHLAMMERVLGKIPSSMRDSSIKIKYFKRGHLDWDSRSRLANRVKNRCRPLMAYMHKRSTKDKQLFDLINRMLEYRPEKRITMKEALKHEFFEGLTEP